ncbi:phosphate signaling complex PhoU family protein [Millisia brevis]|uniref:phosphate signaling complex PhoU family protein n=1 Tax=Millisia brevis TaxID=264148 RepID=UPI00082DFDDD|nr:phosphate uptake regulator PhoU [Millisia brevis]
MRTAYGQEVDELSGLLVDLAELSSRVMQGAGSALTDRDVIRAEEVMTLEDELGMLRSEIDRRTGLILALQAPVATDLRRQVSTLRISGALARMGELAIHVAESVRRRFPDPVVPDPVAPLFREMGRLAIEMSGRVVVALEQQIDIVDELIATDARVDALHARVLEIVKDESVGLTVPEAIDVALLSRFHERFCDHTIEVSRRIAFTVLG